MRRRYSAAGSVGIRRLSILPTPRLSEAHPEGQSEELDEVGRSLSADRRKSANRALKSGFWDQGDQTRKK